MFIRCDYSPNCHVTRCSGRLSVTSGSAAKEQANQEAFRRLCESEPVLEDIRPAIEVLPGMTKNMVLTSGPRLDWEGYFGGQRDAIIGGAVFEGLAEDRLDAEKKLRAGTIRVDGCHAHGAVGSLA